MPLQSTVTAGDRARLPETGRKREEITRFLKELRAADDDPRATSSDRWLNDRGLLIDDGLTKVAKEAFLQFFTKNNSYPPLLRLELQLVQMGLELFASGATAAGSITSGGSESLFLAAAAAMDRAGRARTNAPEVLMADTGYPAFEKYARYLGYSVQKVPSDSFFQADPAAIRDAITDNTVMLVASMGSWAHGACDPIEELAELAAGRDLWLHVDACVGGFLAPFFRELGGELPRFDFSLPGVSSLSADFHKYGYGAKGVSGIFFRDRALAAFQPFVFDDWASGLYRSPVFTGTRSGGAIAATWAVATYLGREGYLRRAAQIAKARQQLVGLVERTPGLCLLGKAQLATVAVGGQDLDIHAVGRHLQSHGWNYHLLKDPPGIQFVLGPLHDDYIRLLVSDLQDAVTQASSGLVFPDRPAVVYSDEMLDEPGSLTFGAPAR